MLLQRSAMKASPIICVDEPKTTLAEDGFYIQKTGRISSTLRLAAVALYEREMLDLECIKRTLRKNKDERFSLGNLKMCSQKALDELNFQNDKEVPAIVVDIELNERTLQVSAGVYLDYVKAFKHHTFNQIAPLIDSGTGTFAEVVAFFKRLRLGGYAETMKGWDDYARLSREENFVRRLVWLFNEVCANLVHTNGVPVIGKQSKTCPVLEVSETNIPIFNCPIRQPVAAINNFNLVHFLQHGEPYFKTTGLERILRDS
jgi:hypothetical protein